jgi:hypothetical protein
MSRISTQYERQQAAVTARCGIARLCQVGKRVLRQLPEVVVLRMHGISQMIIFLNIVRNIIRDINGKRWLLLTGRMTDVVTANVGS